MADDLRTLAQAVVDAEWHWQETGTVTTDPHLTELLNAAPPWLSLSASTTILAALNAAEAQGYARAMGEVEARAEERCVKRRQQADAAEERSPGRSWLLACVIEAALMRDWAKRAARTARERLPAAAGRD